jgi:hypothetical protein
VWAARRSTHFRLPERAARAFGMERRYLGGDRPVESFGLFQGVALADDFFEFVALPAYGELGEGEAGAAWC